MFLQFNVLWINSLCFCVFGIDLVVGLHVQSADAASYGPWQLPYFLPLLNKSAEPSPGDWGERERDRPLSIQFSHLFAVTCISSCLSLRQVHVWSHKSVCPSFLWLWNYYLQPHGLLCVLICHYLIMPNYYFSGFCCVWMLVHSPLEPDFIEHKDNWMKYHSFCDLQCSYCSMCNSNSLPFL